MSRYKLDISRVVESELEGMQPKIYRQVAKKMLALMTDPFPADSQALRGSDFSGYYRVDSGEYRVVYQIEADVVMVKLVAKRNDDEVYRRLKRSV